MTKNIKQIGDYMMIVCLVAGVLFTAFSFDNKRNDTQDMEKEDGKSKRYKDEFGNRIILDSEDKDFHITIKYNKSSVGNCEDESFFVTRKDFEKMKELDVLDMEGEKEWH